MTGLTRRGALLGASAAVAVAGLPIPVTAQPSVPLLTMRDEWVAANSVVAAEPVEDDADAANWARVAAIETRILAAEPRTLLGALVQIEIWSDMAKDGVPDFAIAIAARVAEQVPTRIEGALTGGLPL